MGKTPLLILFQTVFYLVMLFCAGVFGSSASSSTKEVVGLSSVALPYGKRITLPSRFLQAPQLVDVYLPEGFEYDSDHIRYPVIVTLDGWTLSQAVSGVAGHLMNTAALPKSIVVALHTDALPLLPNAYVHSTDNWQADPKDGYVRAFKHNPADAAAGFWRFLEQELFPHLQQHYRANQFRTLVGLSPSAILSLHTLLQKPELFDAYVLIAAIDVLGLGYNEKHDFMDEIIAAAASGKLNNKYFYIASAEFEARRNPKHYQHVDKLSSGLEEYRQKLTYHIEQIDHFDHYPVALPALTNAFNLVFPRDSFQNYRDFLGDGDAIGNLQKYYETLSEHYGFELNIQTNLRRNPNSLRSIGSRLLRQGQYQQAEKAFQLWRELADKSPYAHYWLANLYNTVGRQQQAVELQTRALALARKFQLDNIAQFEQVLTRFKQAKAENQ